MTALETVSPATPGRAFFTAGSVIFREGEPGEVMYVVVDGIVIIQVAGRRLATIGPGGIVGEMALISKQPRSATAIAETDCVLTPVDADQFYALKQQMPTLLGELLDMLSERLQRATIREADQYRPLEVQIRIATPDDLPPIHAIVEPSLKTLGAADYSHEQIRSALSYVAGTDTLDLIVDGTYYVAEIQGEVAGCGGWSRRRALFHDEKTAGDDQPLLDPARDAAKIRQFYVHPRWAKRGIARRLLQTCEDAARAAGFTRLELAATLTGEPLYGVHGFKRVEPIQITLPDGAVLQVIKMEKKI